MQNERSNANQDRDVSTVADQSPSKLPHNRVWRVPPSLSVSIDHPRESSLQKKEKGQSPPEHERPPDQEKKEIQAASSSPKGRAGESLVEIALETKRIEDEGKPLVTSVSVCYDPYSLKSKDGADVDKFIKKGMISTMDIESSLNAPPVVRPRESYAPPAIEDLLRDSPVPPFSSGSAPRTSAPEELPFPESEAAPEMDAASATVVATSSTAVIVFSPPPLPTTTEAEIATEREPMKDMNVMTLDIASPSSQSLDFTDQAQPPASDQPAARTISPRALSSSTLSPGREHNPVRAPPSPRPPPPSPRVASTSKSPAPEPADREEETQRPDSDGGTKEIVAEKPQPAHVEPTPKMPLNTIKDLLAKASVRIASEVMELERSSGLRASSMLASQKKNKEYDAEPDEKESDGEEENSADAAMEEEEEGEIPRRMPGPPRSERPPAKAAAKKSAANQGGRVRREFIKAQRDAGVTSDEEREFVEAVIAMGSKKYANMPVDERLKAMESERHEIPSDPFDEGVVDNDPRLKKYRNTIVEQAKKLKLIESKGQTEPPAKSKKAKESDEAEEERREDDGGRKEKERGARSVNNRDDDEEEEEENDSEPAPSPAREAKKQSAASKKMEERAQKVIPAIKEITNKALSGERKTPVRSKPEAPKPDRARVKQVVPIVVLDEPSEEVEPEPDPPRSALREGIALYIEHLRLKAPKSTLSRVASRDVKFDSLSEEDRRKRLAFLQHVFSKPSGTEKENHVLYNLCMRYKAAVESNGKNERLMTALERIAKPKVAFASGKKAISEGKCAITDAPLSVGEGTLVSIDHPDLGPLRFHASKHAYQLLRLFFFGTHVAESIAEVMKSVDETNPRRSEADEATCSAVEREWITARDFFEAALAHLNAAEKKQEVRPIKRQRK